MLSTSSRLRLIYSSSTLGLHQHAFPSNRLSISSVRHVKLETHLAKNILPQIHEPVETANEGDQKLDQLLSRLKTSEEARRDPQIWNQLTRYLKRSRGENGIETAWLSLIQYPANEVPILYELELWEDLSGRKLVNYIRTLHEIGIKPPLGTLKKVGLAHHSLSLLQPTQDELLEAAMEFVDVKLPENMYNVLIPRLCDKKDYRKALAWHRKFVAKGEPPRSVEDVTRLRQLLLDHKQWSAALEVRRDVTHNATAVEYSQNQTANTSLMPSLEDQNQALQSFVSRLDERVGIIQVNPSMDDHTCARFLATKFFSVEFIMDGLSLFGVSQLGCLALREVVRRSIRDQHCDTSKVRQYFAKMKALGITYDSKYGRMLEHFANLGSDILLHSIVASSFHPDLYDDIEYQMNMLQSSDRLVIERTREVLLFETQDHEVEVRNILLRAGHEDIEAMITGGIPITKKSRTALLEAVYINEKPWISEIKLRTLIRLFSRLPYVAASEWKNVIKSLLCLPRAQLRPDMEAMLRNLKSPDIFDFRLKADIIRWYMRISALGRINKVETMLEGVKVLAALRDLKLVSNIELACQVNLMSLFGDAPIAESIDVKKRLKARSAGNFEDFVIAIRKLYDSNMWPGMSPTAVKEYTLKSAANLRAQRMTDSKSISSSPHSGKTNPGKLHYIRSMMGREARDESDTTKASDGLFR